MSAKWRNGSFTLKNEDSEYWFFGSFEHWFFGSFEHWFFGSFAERRMFIKERGLRVLVLVGSEYWFFWFLLRGLYTR